MQTPDFPLAPISPIVELSPVTLDEMDAPWDALGNLTYKRCKLVTCIVKLTLMGLSDKSLLDVWSYSSCIVVYSA